MRLLIAITSLTCLSLVKSDTPNDLGNVPIERPVIINTEIPPSDIIDRKDPIIVIKDEEPPLNRIRGQGRPALLDQLGGNQLDHVSPEELNEYLNSVIEKVQQEISHDKIVAGVPPLDLPPPPVESVLPTTGALPPISHLNLPSGQSVDRTTERQIEEIFNNAQDLFGAQPTPAGASELSAALENTERAFENFGQLNTMPDLATISTVDNFDNDDAKRLVQLIEERRELLRQLRERERITGIPSNGPNLNAEFARGASFRTSQRLSDNFDDFGIPRGGRTSSVLTPLVGNSIGVPVDVVTDAESRRNNQPSNQLADAGRVNAPATIRQRFPDDSIDSRRLLPGVNVGPRLRPNPFDSNIVQGSDDDSHLNALLLQRSRIQEQLARLSRGGVQGLPPTINPPTPLGISADFGSVPTANGLISRTLDDDNRQLEVGLNARDDSISISNFPFSHNQNLLPSASTPILVPPPGLSPLNNDDSTTFTLPTSRFVGQWPFQPNLINRRSLTRGPGDAANLADLQELRSAFNSFRFDGRIPARNPSSRVLDRPPFGGRPPVPFSGRFNIGTGFPSSSFDDLNGPGDASNLAGLQELRSAFNSFRFNGGIPARNPSSRVLDRPPFGGMPPVPFSGGFNIGTGFPSSSFDDFNRNDGQPGLVSNSQPALQGFLSSLEDFRNRPGVSGVSSSVQDVRPGLRGQVSPIPLHLQTRRTGQLEPPRIFPESRLSNDDGNIPRDLNAITGQALRPETRQTGSSGFLSQSLDDFPDFNRQVESLFQSAPGFNSVSFRGSNDDNFPQRSFGRHPVVPGTPTATGLRGVQHRRVGGVF